MTNSSNSSPADEMTVTLEIVNPQEKPGEYIKKAAGDIIAASDWNQMQLLIQSHINQAYSSLQKAVEIVNAINEKTGPISLTSAADSSTPNKETNFKLSVNCDLELKNNLTVGNTIMLPGNKEIYFAENGQIRSLDDTHRILFRRSEDKMELREYGDIILSAGSTDGKEKDTVLISKMGNVGIGNVTPDIAYKLHVNGSTKINGSLALDNNLSVGNTIMLPANKEIYFADNGQIRSLDDTHRILFRRSENKLELREYGDIILSAGSKDGTEKDTVLISQMGNVGIGNITPDIAYKLHVNGSTKINGSLVPSVGNAENNGIMFPKDPGGGGGDTAWIRYYVRENPESCTLEVGISNDTDDYIYLNSSGGVRYSGNLSAASDKQLKTNISTISSALDHLVSLRGVKFAWKSSPSEEPVCFGMIAQEVQQVFPNLITQHNETLHLDYIGIIPVLIESIKQQQDQINSLKAALQHLSANIPSQDIL